jgi:hypothetical protein
MNVDTRARMDQCLQMIVPGITFSLFTFYLSRLPADDVHSGEGVRIVESEGYKKRTVTLKRSGGPRFYSSSLFT